MMDDLSLTEVNDQCIKHTDQASLQGVNKGHIKYALGYLLSCFDLHDNNTSSSSLAYYLQSFISYFEKYCLTVLLPFSKF